MEHPIVGQIGKKTGVNMGEIMKLVQDLQTANFKDEATVRAVVRRVARIANRNVSSAVENQLVQTIVKDGKRLDMNALADLLEGKRK